MMWDRHTLNSTVRQMIDDFELDTDKINSVSNASRGRMSDLLARDGATQIPSFVTKLPRGSETGEFLVVDIGGSHCRVCLIDLQGNSQYGVKHVKVAIPKEVMTASSHELLFDFVAATIHDFLQNNLHEFQWVVRRRDDSQTGNHELLRLSFTFSFTYKTISLSEGKMLQWDKGWNIPDAIGRDPCQMLQGAIDRQGMRIYVCALTNDSVSTLVAEAFLLGCQQPPLASIILGTGTNAAYTEKLENIVKLPDNTGHRSKQTEEIMIINSEWGAWFDNSPSNLPQTEYDRELDAGSSNSNEQLFEKMVSGLYLAELLRLAILKAMRQDILTFSIDGKSPLHTPYGLDGKLLSCLANERTDDCVRLMEHLSTILVVPLQSPEEARFIQQLSAAIVRRAARLLGAVIAALILQSGWLSCSPHRSQMISVQNTQQTRGHGRTLQATTKAGEISVLELQSHDQCVHGSATGHAHTENYIIPSYETIVIGVEGPLFEFYPSFEGEIRKALLEIKGIGAEGEGRIRFNLTRDGSTLGAALIACFVSGT